MIQLLKSRLARSMALLGCSVFLLACEAVPTEGAALEKELAGKVSVGIRPIESQLLAEEPMEVLFYLNNGTDESIEILPWGTPLESIMTADRFTVSVAGKVMPYSGRIVKRPAPTADDYVTLAAGEKKEAVVSLSDGYDVSASGEYVIVLREFIFQGKQSDMLTPVMAENTVAVTRQ